MSFLLNGDDDDDYLTRRKRERISLDNIAGGQLAAIRAEDTESHDHDHIFASLPEWLNITKDEYLNGIERAKKLSAALKDEMNRVKADRIVSKLS